jgi:uncharacterized RDD family membrane protein YckC
MDCRRLGTYPLPDRHDALQFSTEPLYCPCMNETLSGTFFCNKCGTLNTVGAQFCSQCGASTNPAAGATSTAGASTPPPPANPYPPAAYPGATPYPAVAAAGGVRYGGFWIRVVAAIIDAIVVRVVAAPIGMLFGLGGLAGSLGGFPHGAGLHLLGGGVVAAVVIFGSWLYEAFMLSSPYQATLGKMIFGMKVTDLHGNRISFARATGRHFAKWLSGMILCIGFIMVGVTQRKQGLHDMLAETLVRIG